MGQYQGCTPDAELGKMIQATISESVLDNWQVRPEGESLFSFAHKGWEKMQSDTGKPSFAEILKSIR